MWVGECVSVTGLAEGHQLNAQVDIDLQEHSYVSVLKSLKSQNPFYTMLSSNPAPLWTPVNPKQDIISRQCPLVTNKANSILGRIHNRGTRESREVILWLYAASGGACTRCTGQTWGPGSSSGPRTSRRRGTDWKESRAGMLRDLGDTSAGRMRAV